MAPRFRKRQKPAVLLGVCVAHKVRVRSRRDNRAPWNGGLLQRALSAPRLISVSAGAENEADSNELSAVMPNEARICGKQLERQPDPHLRGEG